MASPDATQPTLISALLQSALFGCAPRDIELVETHISWVILAGDYAYKIKKSLDLGFLDFSTLDRRRHFCEEELRLNRRLAPAVYLDVVAVTGTPEAPALNGAGEAIEYAVRMTRFPQDAQLDNLLTSGALGPAHIDAIAHMMAAFHQRADTANGNSPYGDPGHVLQPVAENFTQVRERVTRPEWLRELAGLEQWSHAEFDTLQPAFIERKRQGHVRECHGDLHLRNLAWWNDGPIAFDCIEFSPGLRWIDTLSDIAFLVMDLHDRGQAALASRFLNAYLEQAGDYEGVVLLPFYLVYRAMVRAKVDTIRAAQPGIEDNERRQAESELYTYLQLAQSYTRAPAPKLIITHGVSASGKSTLTQALLEKTGAVRVRSDVERKRLHGSADGERGSSGGMYSAGATARTYDRLLELADAVLRAGYSVIVDATFLKYSLREAFRKLAASSRAPFVILELSAPPGTLRRRIIARHGDVSDADLDVLDSQLRHNEPLRDVERKYTITLDTAEPLEIGQLAEAIGDIQPAT